MTGSIYIGDSAGIAKKIGSLYVSVNDLAKKVNAVYIGDESGIARKVYELNNVNETAVSIPKMTSNTAPSGTASASSEYNTNSKAWKAFDGNVSTQWASAYGTTSMTGTAWLQYDFGYAVRPTLMTYKVASSYRPKNYSLLGSNDSSAFTELSAGALPNSAEVFTVKLSVKERYRIFRLVLTNKYSANARFYVAVFGIDGFVEAA